MKGSCYYYVMIIIIYNFYKSDFNSRDLLSNSKIKYTFEIIYYIHFEII